MQCLWIFQEGNSTQQMIRACPADWCRRSPQLPERFFFFFPGPTGQVWICGGADFLCPDFAMCGEVFQPKSFTFFKPLSRLGNAMFDNFRNPIQMIAVQVGHSTCVCNFGSSSPETRELLNHENKKSQQELPAKPNVTPLSADSWVQYSCSE